MKITINEENYLKLEAFKELLEKDESTIINEALQRFFEAEQKRLVDEEIEKQKAQTNLSYDEFWDGIDF